MTIEFQRNVLKYLFQHKIDMLEYLTPKMFDTVELQACFSLYVNYLEKYKSLPERANFIQFASNHAQFTEESINFIRNASKWIYEPLDDVTLVQEELLNKAKQTMFKLALVDGLKAHEKGLSSEDIDSLFNKMSKIRALTNNKKNEGLFLLRDLNKFTTQSRTIYPTYLNTLNNMTSMGGFHSPQSIVFMGPPKSFKTGVLIKFALEYMKDGLDVMYPDFENGQEDIHLRFKQGMLQCKIEEVNSRWDTLAQIKQKLLDYTGTGEVFIKKYRKKKDHFGHVRIDLDKLMDQGYNIKALFPDYIDIMGCSDKYQKDPRLKIQQNYADLDEINNEYGTFSMTVSKMTSGGWKKEWPGPEDIGEDKEKIYNAHAVFAIMRNEEDIDAGVGRIIPIVQRQGVSYVQVACELNIDVENFIIEEL